MNKLTLTGVVLLAIAVSLASGEVRDGPERTIEKPSSRAATAFVPRLGKRMANNMNSNQDGLRLGSTGRIVCANSLDCNQLVLLGALLRGIALQEGDLNLVPTDQLDDVLVTNNLPQSGASSFDSTNEDGLKLLRMLHRGQMLRRETRASLDGDEELVNAVGGSVEAPKYGGTKRVAFTPRIGKR